MLSIKRVATMVSNHQNEEEEEKGGGCGRNCLGKCCLQGAKLPLYTFRKTDTEKDLDAEDQESHLLETLLLGEWEDRMRKGLFRYDVTSCETKVIPGKYGFIAQLNEGRHLKKRPTEFRVDKVLQSFEESKFNFTKVGQEEVLFRFEESSDAKAQYFKNASIHASSSPNVVAINVSPIEYGHVLLIPRVLECLPQRIDPESFLLALHMAAEAGNPYFRLGYNSLGAFATINHLHFQAYFMAMPFPIEKAPTQKIMTVKGVLESGVKIYQLLNYPVRGLVFEGGKALKDLADVVSTACICLQDSNVPYNVLIADSGKRVFLFPQCYAEKQALGEVNQELLDTQVNPAVWEISGHMVLKRKKDYEEASEDNAWKLLAEVSLSEERFQEVKACILEAISAYAKGVDKPTHQEEDEETEAVNQGHHQAMTPMKEKCLLLH